MIEKIDNFLNKITMYRLVLYCLSLMVAGALALSFFNILPYDPSLFLLGTAFILLICLIANKIFAKIFGAETNIESVYITALILVLIITPLKTSTDFYYFGFLFWAALWSMASKYIFAIGKKHLFNPVAFAVALTALTINQSASWWVGTLAMAPFVIVGGLLITRKIRRFDLVLSFILVGLTAIIGMRAFDLSSGFHIGIQALFYSPLLFFAFVMLTEPLTTPPKTTLRILYGAITGFLFSPLVHIASLYSTPELALLAGNIFSYIVSPKEKLILKLKEKIKITDSTYDFVFTPDRKLNFRPGQYLEWTMGNKKSDSRGNRRYFTIASSPTEEEIRMGVKFYPNGSTFKTKLLDMNIGETIVASQRAGEFIMPRDSDKKLVFLAGGIGITPFRSMLKYLIDKKEKRDIIMLYSNRTPGDIAYKNIISEAEMKIGLKNIYTITDTSSTGEMWPGKTGFINEQMIVTEVPDYLDRYFYISGTHGMVVTFEKILSELGVHKSRIKKDFFPGFV